MEWITEHYAKISSLAYSSGKLGKRVLSHNFSSPSTSHQKLMTLRNFNTRSTKKKSKIYIDIHNSIDYWGAGIALWETCAHNPILADDIKVQELILSLLNPDFGQRMSYIRELEKKLRAPISI